MPGTRNRAGLFLVYFFVCSLRSRSQKLVSATASQASLRSRQFKSGKCNFKSDKSFVRCAQVKFKDGNRNRNRNRNRNPRSSMDSRTSSATAFHGLAPPHTCSVNANVHRPPRTCTTRRTGQHKKRGQCVNTKSVSYKNVPCSAFRQAPLGLLYMFPSSFFSNI